jgi:pimeloyl-ACP methyl ester carboxylesterase
VRRLLLAGVAAAAVLAAIGPGTAAERPALMNPRPCEGAPRFTCSTLRVPLDHSGKTRGTIALQVATAPRSTGRKGVLLMLSGGPGQPGVPLVPRISGRLARVVDDYRLVMLDQRGTGANALVCAALQEQMGVSDLRRPTAGAVRACGAKVGARRRFYTTLDTVADLELLRRALGVERWVVDGVSYGSYVAARYALRHPQRTTKLVLDSVVPHGGIDMLAVTSMPATARVLRTACAAAGCGTDPVADLARVVRRYGNGVQVLDALVVMSIVDPTFTRNVDIPGLLHAAANGDRSGLDVLLANVKAGTSAPAGTLSQGLHASTLCTDLPAPWGTSATPSAGRLRAVRREVAALRTRDVWPYDRATAQANGFLQTCLHGPPTAAAPQPRRGEKLAVPTLLLNGDRDLSTPLAWARQEGALAPEGRLVVIPGAGHSVQTRDPSGRGIRALADFLGS